MYACVLGLALFLTSMVLVVSAVPPQVRPATETGAVAHRRQAVENGLLPKVVIKGRPLTGMKLTDRMAYYKVPGVSIAVINRGKIEWASGYGRLEAGDERSVEADTLFQA
jgi:CubicO group peptidase (beta-lactamase class C family)